MPQQFFLTNSRVQEIKECLSDPRRPLPPNQSLADIKQLLLDFFTIRTRQPIIVGAISQPLIQLQNHVSSGGIWVIVQDHTPYTEGLKQFFTSLAPPFCKICTVNPSVYTFQPCGCLCFCTTCGEHMMSFFKSEYCQQVAGVDTHQCKQCGKPFKVLARLASNL